jgi:hypothetical protein
MGLTNEILRVSYPDDTGGIVKETTKVVDNVFVTQDDENVKWERVPDGVFRAAWIIGLAPTGDQTWELQNILNNSQVSEVIFDSGDVTITGTLNCSNKIVTFRGNGRIVGSGTVSNARLNGVINATPVTATTSGCTLFYYTVPGSGGISGSGAFSSKIRVIDDADFTIASDDFTVLIKNNTTGRTATMFTAAGNTNRILRIVNTGSATVTTSIALRVSPSTTTTSIGANTTVEIHSDGTDLWIIGIYSR